MRAADVFFTILALVAVACVATLISLEVMEKQYYEQAPTVWDAPAGMSR